MQYENTKPLTFLALVNYRCLSKKPTNIETAGIQQHFILERLDVPTLRKWLLRGATIKPAVTDTEKHFISQQVFFVDVDHNRRVLKNLRTAKKTEIIPNLVYKTFSATTKEQRHRIVVVLAQPVNDIQLRDEIQKKLNLLFGGDKACLHYNCIFYGGNAGYFYNPYLYTSIEQIKEVTFYNEPKH